MMRDEIIAALDAIPALVDDDGPRNYTDEAPDDAAFPYTVLRLDISETPALEGDRHVLAVGRLHQLDTFESRAVESEALRLAVWGLDGMRFSDALKLSVRSCTRVPDPNFELVHRAYTLSVKQLRRVSS